MPRQAVIVARVFMTYLVSEREDHPAGLPRFRVSERVQRASPASNGTQDGWHSRTAPPNTVGIAKRESGTCVISRFYRYLGMHLTLFDKEGPGDLQLSVERFVSDYRVQATVAIRWASCWICAGARPSDS